jgi:glucokinase
MMNHYPSFRYQISSKGELLKRLSRLFKQKFKDKIINYCIIDFAGPVYHNQKVRMTNWEDQPEITPEELFESGLPKNNTLMINDIEAAAYGIIALAETNQLDSAHCHALYQSQPVKAPGSPRGNMVLIMPGTGLGTAGIVTLSKKNGKSDYFPLPSEIAHAPASPVNSEHASMMEWFKQGEFWPTWEDFISGRGLHRIYQGLSQNLSVSQKKDLPDILSDKDDPAAEIARAAVRQENEIAERALHLYYSCIGQVAQILALVYQPFGGIFLCGDVVLKDQSFIPGSNLLKNLHQNKKQSELLKEFPVFIVTVKNLNLLGNLWIARKKVAK